MQNVTRSRKWKEDKSDPIDFVKIRQMSPVIIHTDYAGRQARV